MKRLTAALVAVIAFLAADRPDPSASLTDPPHVERHAPRALRAPELVDVYCQSNDGPRILVSAGSTRAHADRYSSLIEAIDPPDRDATVTCTQEPAQ